MAEQQVVLPIIFKKSIALFVLVSGLLLYFAWAALYNAWTDVGLYAITVPIIGLGASGYYLFSIKDEET